MFRINLLQSYKVHDDGRLRREINNIYFYPYLILYYTTISNITNTKISEIHYKCIIQPGIPEKIVISFLYHLKQ